MASVLESASATGATGTTGATGAAAQRIKHLFLGGNGVTDAGALALANALKLNGKHSLQRLSLEGGSIGDVGATALAEAAGRSSTLTSLDLRSCLPTRRCEGQGPGTAVVTLAGVAAVKDAMIARKGLQIFIDAPALSTNVGEANAKGERGKPAGTSSSTNVGTGTAGSGTGLRHGGVGGDRGGKVLSPLQQRRAKEREAASTQ